MVWTRGCFWCTSIMSQAPRPKRLQREPPMFLPKKKKKGTSYVDKRGGRPLDLKENVPF